MKKNYIFSLCLFMLIIFVCIMTVSTHDVSAATTGKISGIVTDEGTEQPLANAKVTIVGTSTTATTNDSGYYVMTNIPPAGYDVIVEITGYRSKTVEATKVFAGLTTTINFALQPSEVVELEGITVTAARPLIKKDVTQTTRIIEADEIESMPRDTVNGILQTQAGVAVLNATGSVHVRGGRSMEIKYLIDGIPVNDPIFSGLGLQISTNAIEQMEVITGGFNAEHGDAQSGIINLITKAGTHKFKGRFRYRVGQWGQHHGDPIYGPWFDPDNDFRPVALAPFRGIFIGKPYDYQTPYRGDPVTVEELANREGDEKVIFTEILPGVYADRTENLLQPIIDPETGESMVDEATGEVIMERQPFKDADGTVIDYENKKVILFDGYIVDLEQYSELFNATKDYNLSPSHIGEFALSGPIMGNKLTFSFASQFRRDESYLPNDDSGGYTLQGKLKYEITPEIKLHASGLYDEREINYYGGSLRFVPSAIEVGNRDGRSLSAQLSHNINSGTFYTLTLGQFRRASSSHQPGKMWDPLNRTFAENAWDPDIEIDPDIAEQYPDRQTAIFMQNQREGRIRNPAQQAYNDTTYDVAGDNNFWNTRNSTTTIFKGDFTSQVTENHQVQAGVEFSSNHLYNLGTTNYGSSNLYVEYYDVVPTSLSLYAQDKMEYEGMIVNIGLRYDRYNPDGGSPEDPLNPLVLKEDGTILYTNSEGPEADLFFLVPDVKKYINELQGSFDSLPAVGLPIINKWKKASTKHMIAPRLGISFPITERAKFHFTYGHYYQVPRGDDLYENLNFDMRGAIRRRGNPDLEPEKTIAYEVGIIQQFTDDLTVDITGFTKDINNLVSSVHVDITNDYSYFINDIYGRVQGFELTIRKWRTGNSPVSGMLSYTYSVAKGKGSSRNLGYLTYYRQQPEVTESHPLSWDQRHIVSAALDIQLPFASAVNFVGRYASGLPYTPNPRAPIKPAVNSKRYPATYNVDALVSKRSRIGGVTYTFFADIRNIFNTKNLDNILDAVTYDRYGIPLTAQKHTSPASWSSPRLVMVGVSLDF
ncbi:TonB-dependent receptor [Candidatus Poribacteria bacterium]|nr:TonB-dependent receptor [Candidatus Poribacteria bacterium]